MDKVACIFPGQGAQVVGMGKDIYEKYEVAKKVFDTANEILGFDLKRICFQGSISEILNNNNLSLTVYVTCIALFHVLESSTDLTKSYMAGHSLGEITALTCCGALSFEDGLELVQKRSKYAVEAMKKTNGFMAIVEFLSESEVQEICMNMEHVYLSCSNSVNQYSISGEEDEMAQAFKQLQGKGARVTPLFFSPPFHCPLMNEVAIKFAEDLKKITFRKQLVSVISNVTGEIYEVTKDPGSYLMEQLTRPVQWIKTLNTFEKTGVQHLIEITPKSILKDFCSSKSYDCSVFHPCE